jgi:hypothetical protein
LFGKTGVFLHRIVQAICFKKPVESLNSFVKQLFGKKGLFFHSILQAICFKKPLESLNSCQTIVRQKRLIFQLFLYIEQTIFKKIDCCSKQFIKNLTARIKNFV